MLECLKHITRIVFYGTLLYMYECDGIFSAYCRNANFCQYNYKCYSYIKLCLYCTYHIFQKAIEYLLPSGLYDKKARPLMKVRALSFCPLQTEFG